MGHQPRYLVRVQALVPSPWDSPALRRYRSVRQSRERCIRTPKTECTRRLIAVPYRLATFKQELGLYVGNSTYSYSILVDLPQINGMRLVSFREQASREKSSSLETDGQHNDNVRRDQKSRCGGDLVNAYSQEEIQVRSRINSREGLVGTGGRKTRI